MGVNTNRDIPEFPDNETVHRSDLRLLGSRFEKLANDFASRYATGGYTPGSDRFTFTYFPAIVYLPYYRSLDEPQPSAQYVMIRAIATTGLDTFDRWNTQQETIPGIAENFVATNYAELNINGNATGNSVPSGQQVMVCGVWNRNEVTQEGGTVKPKSTNLIAYIFYFAVGISTPLLIKSVNANWDLEQGASRYNVAVGKGSVFGVDPDSNFVPPDELMTFPTDANALAVDVFEGGSAASGTCLMVVGSIVLGTLNGTDNENPALPVYYFSSAPSGTAFKVLLTQVGGTQGDATTRATWTYNGFIFDGSGLQLFAGLSPDATTRPIGQINKAGQGWAIISNGGAIVLAEAIEPPITGACTPVAGTGESPAGPSYVGY